MNSVFSFSFFKQNGNPFSWSHLIFKFDLRVTIFQVNIQKLLGCTQASSGSLVEGISVFALLTPQHLTWTLSSLPSPPSLCSVSLVASQAYVSGHFLKASRVSPPVLTLGHPQCLFQAGPFSSSIRLSNTKALGAKPAFRIPLRLFSSFQQMTGEEIKHLQDLSEETPAASDTHISCFLPTCRSRRQRHARFMLPAHMPVSKMPLEHSAPGNRMLSTTFQ